MLIYKVRLLIYIFTYECITKEELINKETIVHSPTQKQSPIPLNTYKLFGYDLPTTMNLI